MSVSAQRVLVATRATMQRKATGDPNDDMLVELAVASRSGTIVTHNTRDFDNASSLGLRILTPGAFIRQFLES